MSDLCAAKREILPQEIILTYSDFAILFHGVCHFLWKIKLNFSRFMANVSRIFTSIEIHPAVVIDEGFIDHGSGLVIGETSMEKTSPSINKLLWGLSPL